MKKRMEEMSGKVKVLRYAFFVGAIILPFALQTSHLHAVRGGWRPESANLASLLLLPSLLLPVVSLIFLPFSWKVKIGILMIFMPVLIFAFGFYSLTIACGKYGYIGSCF